MFKAQLVPYTRWISISINTNHMLFWLQLVSSSFYWLAKQDFGQDLGSDIKNRKLGLNIFYGLALAEGNLFLLEKAYME